MEKEVKITLTFFALNKTVSLEYLWGTVFLSEAAVYICCSPSPPSLFFFSMVKWSKYWNILPVCIFIALKKRSNAINIPLKAGTAFLGWLWFLQLKFIHFPKSSASVKICSVNPWSTWKSTFLFPLFRRSQVIYVILTSGTQSC